MIHVAYISIGFDQQRFDESAICILSEILIEHFFGKFVLVDLLSLKTSAFVDRFLWLKRHKTVVKWQDVLTEPLITYPNFVFCSTGSLIRRWCSSNTNLQCSALRMMLIFQFGNQNSAKLRLGNSDLREASRYYGASYSSLGTTSASTTSL